MTDTEKRPDDPSATADSAVLDAKGLRALAHPVRLRLLGLLRRYGPSTATRLAERLGVNSGTASYHLRRLGAAGFVEEDTERGNARERWWRSVHRMTEMSILDLVEQEPEAALAYLQSVAATYTLRTQQTLNELETMPRPWRSAVDLSDRALRLTPDEAVALREELWAVIARYDGDTPESDVRAAEGAARVGVIVQVLPELDTPASAEDPTP
ncbi:helix-turn-helix domain-containing protein [Streptomyces sp. MMS24-I2-30]|uniref:helix-turn-helix domain-containing protein n=1 Tax=Streptomyces sp. MMS24-I2-30 TaxID=3351564 RepID=UPI003896D6BC